MWTFLRRRSLTQWIIAAMVVGVLIGVFFPQFAVSLRPISTVFLRMIKSIIVPLIFGTLVVGIAGHGDDMKRVGRLALKSIIYFEVVTTLALFIGLLAVNILKPGVGVSLVSPETAGAVAVGGQVTFTGVLEHIVPQSFSRPPRTTKCSRSCSGPCSSRSGSRRCAAERRRRCSIL